MTITFHKLPGDPAVGVAFFWRLALSGGPARTDLYIPELFFDYLHLQRGRVQVLDPARPAPVDLAAPCLKPLYTHTLRLRLTPPLVLYGARCSLAFAERYWQPALPANRLVPQRWAAGRVRDLPSFAAQVRAHLQARQVNRTPYPMFAAALTESAWLRAYSPRQKRRWYQVVFGLSRQALLRLQSVQAFLEQTCSFDTPGPRIIQHVDPDQFYDQPHLNHVFKTLTGLAPVEYFAAGSLLQDNLMAASYNAPPADLSRL